MAQYRHLPIYKATYDLLVQITHITKHFPKDFKHSLGARLREETIDLVVYIYKANGAVDKKEYLRRILERMQVVELLLRLSRDMRLISLKQLSSTVPLTDFIGRQAQGWLTATAK